MEHNSSVCFNDAFAVSAQLKSSSSDILVRQLIERVGALEKVIHTMQTTTDSSGPKFLKKQSFQRDALDSPDPKRCPYSAVEKNPVPYVFQMPLHYPRYTKSDYEVMPEWKLDRLLEEYGLPVTGSLSEKRKYAMGSFLWQDQL